MQEWFDLPQHLDLIIAPEGDYSKPHGQVRFLDEIDEFHKWHWLELRHLHRDITTDEVQAFVDTFPEKRPPIHRLMITTKGYTQTATVLAQQHGVHCILVAYDALRRDYGYLKPNITVQNIKTVRQLSQREWNKIHDRLNDSLTDPEVEAVLKSDQGFPSYHWHHLRNALPISEPYDKVEDYSYDLPGYCLQVTDLDELAIEGVSFRYSTTFHILEGDNEAEAVADLLKEILLDRV